MPVKLNSSGGGSITLDTPVTASAYTLTVPAVTATVVTDSSGVLNIGSGQLYKDASGNLGIGTTNPGFKLEIISGYNNGINLKDNTGTVYGGMFVESGTFAVRSRSNHNLMFATNDTERMKINTAGYVTKPYQAVYAGVGRSGGGALNTSGEGNYTIWIPNVSQLNRGSNFNTSTGRFTCPVAGVYYVHAWFLCRPNGAHNVQIYKNGSGTSLIGRDITSSPELCTQVTGYVDCAANDILDIRVSNSGGDFYPDFNGILISLFG
jgi:hypothetical protein